MTPVLPADRPAALIMTFPTDTPACRVENAMINARGIP
jgi:hypothetical protein